MTERNNIDEIELTVSLNQHHDLSWWINKYPFRKHNCFSSLQQNAKKESAKADVFVLCVSIYTTINRGAGINICKNFTFFLII